MFDASVLAFTVAAALLTVIPGPDTMLVLRNLLVRGQRAGLITTVGICTGLFVHATLSALGLSVILLHSAIAFEALKIAGACYLVTLGVLTLVQSLRERSAPAAFSPPESARVVATVGGWAAFSEGLLNNVLNPKAAIFYLAFLPQFIGPSDPVLMKSLFLAGIHFVLGMLWLSSLVLFFGKMRHWLSRPVIRRRLELATGTLLVGMGVRLALERR